MKKFDRFVREWFERRRKLLIADALLEGSKPEN